MTFSAPFQLNTDAEPPGLSGSPTYRSARLAPSSPCGMTRAETSPAAALVVPAIPCYQMHARKSTDNGVTWLADETFSDVVSPLPCNLTGHPGDLCGRLRLRLRDSNRARHFMGGRARAINGASQQDVFTDRERWVQHLRPVHPRRRLRQLLQRRQLQQRQRLARQAIRQLLPLAR